MKLIAGAGKTVLTSTFLNELVLPRRQPDTMVAYYYFDFREKGSQTPEALLGSILNQICAQLDAILFVTSRPEKDISVAFSGNNQIEIRISPSWVMFMSILSMS